MCHIPAKLILDQVLGVSHHLTGLPRHVTRRVQKSWKRAGKKTKQARAFARSLCVEVRFADCSSSRQNILHPKTFRATCTSMFFAPLVVGFSCQPAPASAALVMSSSAMKLVLDDGKTCQSHWTYHFKCSLQPLASMTRCNT